MTKETYFEMCDMLGTEPSESEIPVEMTDFPYLVQLCSVIYSKLTDVWEYMNGNYCGKDYSIVFTLLDLHYVDNDDERLLALDILHTMDNCRIETIALTKNSAPKPAE